jgi:hypothetical protein
MKKIIYLVCLVSIIATIGCNSNPTGPEKGSGGLGNGNGTGNGNGNVSIQVQGQADGQGNYIFSLNPSAEVTFSTITASVPAANYTESYDFSGFGEWQANNFQGFLAYDANVIEQGQAWTFKCDGKTVNDNKEFSVTVNYTVQ